MLDTKLYNKFIDVLATLDDYHYEVNYELYDYGHFLTLSFLSSIPLTDSKLLFRDIYTVVIKENHTPIEVYTIGVTWELVNGAKEMRGITITDHFGFPTSFVSFEQVLTRLKETSYIYVDGDSTPLSSLAERPYRLNF